MFLFVLQARIRVAIDKAMACAKKTVREALRPAPVATGLVSDAFRSKEELLAENAMLRQQLLVASRKARKPPIRPLERGLMVFLASRLWHWRDALLLVKPETLLHWHREGFRLFWKRKSKCGKPPKGRLAADLAGPRSPRSGGSAKSNQQPGNRAKARRPGQCYGP